MKRNIQTHLVAVTATMAAILCLFGHVAIAVEPGEVEADIITATNMVRQTTANGTNTFAGKVGIGTVSPEHMLHVKSSGGFSYPIVVEDSGGDAIMKVQDNVAYGGDLRLMNASGVQTVRLLDSGSYLPNLRIGSNATSGSAMLQIDADTQWPLAIKNMNGNNLFRIYKDGSDHAIATIYDSTGAGKVSLNSDGDSSFLGGNVGIGTNYPTSLLHVAGSVMIDGPMEVTEQGDISMGGFTNGLSSSGASSAETRIPCGYIKDAWVAYGDSDTITVTPGEGYCNGHYFRITNEITHDLISLESAQDFHYIYIDNDESDYPYSPEIIDSTTEPSKSGVLQGWYNGEDRCIGAVFSPSGSAGITNFYGRNGLTWVGIGPAGYLSQGDGPSVTWISPSQADCDSCTPTNAVAVLLNCWFGDSDSASRFYVTTKEIAENASMADRNMEAFLGAGEPSGTFPAFTSWLPLDESRKIKYATQANDDSSVYIFALGWELDR